MGAKLSIDECQSQDSQRVKDCCHLEGETPIEIRIAYQQPRPAAQPVTAHPHAAGHGHGFARSAWDNRHPQADGMQQRHAAFQSFPASMDAEKPPMPRGTERLRLPPPSGSARAQQRTPASQASTSDFDADTFAAPPDSERSEAAASPGRMGHPAAIQVMQLPDDNHFPEIVRVTGRGTGTFREMSTNRSTHRDSTQGSPATSASSPAPTSLGGFVAHGSSPASAHQTSVQGGSPKDAPPSGVVGKEVNGSPV